MATWRTRLLVDDPLAPGAELRLPAEQAHYLAQVLRLGAGAEVALFNGRDGEWLAQVTEAGRKAAGLRLLRQLRPQEPEPDLWLLFAPIKAGRIDWLVEKAVELGVSRLQPAMTRYTAVARVNTARLRAHAREAAEQCERLSVPEVAEPVTLAEALARWPAERRLLFCDEAGGPPPALDALRGAARGTWAVLTGPEGGFARDEAEAIRALPQAQAIGLGPRVLRADTAAVAALILWQAALGDWNRTRRWEAER